MKRLLLFLGIEITLVFFGLRTFSFLSQIVPVTEAKSISEPAVDLLPQEIPTLPPSPTAASIPTFLPDSSLAIGNSNQRSFDVSPTATLLPTQASTPTSVPTAQPETAPTRTIPPALILTATPGAERAAFDQFLKSVSNKKPNQVTGIYVADHFALPVLQQPAGNAGYVVTQDQTLTQFATPKSYGTLAFLAHNFLSGKKFFDLHEGNDVVVVFGNGYQEKYRITRIERYQALMPDSPTSDFIDLADPKKTRLSVTQVFNRIYTQPNRLVFQTCIEANGNSSWGRIFVIAEKVEQQPVEMLGLN